MELTLATLQDYLRRRRTEIGVFEPDPEFHIEEIGDGNLNTVYRVADATRSEYSLVLKHAQFSRHINDTLYIFDMRSPDESA